VISFNGRNFCGKGSLNIFVVKLLLSTGKNSTGAYAFINFGRETFMVYFETAKTVKVSPIEAYHVYSMLTQRPTNNS